jgi:integrase
VPSTEKMGPGKYRAIWRDAAGKKHHSRAPYFTRMADAREYAIEQEAKARRQVARREGVLSARITWSEWWELLSARRKFDSDTGHTERHIVNKYLEPQWGHMRLNAISHQAVRIWVEELKIGRKPGYVHRIFSVFNVSIKAALKEGVLLASPCAGIDNLPHRPKLPKEYATTEYVERVKEGLREDYADVMEFYLETGMRPNEVSGLHEHRIDWNRGFVTVCEVFVRRQRVIKPFPKNRAARTIPVSDRALEIMKRRLAGRPRTGGCGLVHTDGSTCHGTLVFVSLRGRPMNPSTIAYHLRKAAISVGVQPKGAYAGRRGFASRAATGGMDAFELARVMGHDVKIAQEYVQETPGARERLQRALGERTHGLTVISGGTASGTESGTRGDSQAFPNAPVRSTENTG